MNRPATSQFVIPAKAGIQVFNLLSKEKFKNWIPAFAGMTIFFFFLSSPTFAKTTIPFDTGTPDEIVSALEQVVMKKDATPALLNTIQKTLNASDVELRVKERCAWALGQLDAQSAVPALTLAGGHKSLIVRSAALNALLRLRPRSALSLFTAIAQSDPILSLRQRATIALGLLQSEKAIAPLVDLSVDEREEIRGAAALSMAATHTAKNNFSQALTEMKSDLSPYVQERAGYALEVIERRKEGVRSQLKSEDSDVRLFAGLYFQSHGLSSDIKSIDAALDVEASDEVRAQLNQTIRAIKKRKGAEKNPAKINGAKTKSKQKKK